MRIHNIDINILAIPLFPAIVFAPIVSCARYDRWTFRANTIGALEYQRNYPFDHRKSHHQIGRGSKPMCLLPQLHQDYSYLALIDRLYPQPHVDRRARIRKIWSNPEYGLKQHEKRQFKFMCSLYFPVENLNSIVILKSFSKSVALSVLRNITIWRTALLSATGNHDST